MITGRSGSGKSTLLNLLAGMLTPTSGSVMVDGEELYGLAEPARARLRNERIGLVPQGHTALRRLALARVLELLRAAVDAGAAALVVTHEGGVDRLADRSLGMDGGRLMPGAGQSS